MATATSFEPTLDETGQCVTLYGIGWDGYRRMLRMRGERSRPIASLPPPLVPIADGLGNPRLDAKTRGKRRE
jgi:hypothetical protein